MINRPLKSSEWVRKELLSELTDGKWAAGDKLPSVVELAERFGVGRSTIREALSALKATGWLDVRQGGGTYAKAAPANPSFESLTDWMENASSLLHLVEVRKVFETGNASLAARRRTDADVDALRAAIGDMRNALDDEKASEQADTAFHLLLAEATHNPLLIELTRSMSERLQNGMKHTRSVWFFADRRSAETLLEEHEAIVEAVAAADDGLAAERMDAHLSKVENVLRDRI